MRVCIKWGVHHVVIYVIRCETKAAMMLNFQPHWSINGGLLGAEYDSRKPRAYQK